MAYMGLYKSPEGLFIRSTSSDNDIKLKAKNCILIIELKGRDISALDNGLTITAREYLKKDKGE